LHFLFASAIVAQEKEKRKMLLPAGVSMPAALRVQ
jgi:hypothetical protein